MSVGLGCGESLGLGVDAVACRVRRRGRARAWLTAAGVSAALLVAACSTSGRPAAAQHSNDPARADVTARSATEAATVRIVPAPYQLPSGVAQEAVLPHGADLLLLGGLNQRSAASASILRLNPVTGSTTAAGRLASATAGAGGVTLNGRDFLFGGVSTQQIDGRGTATMAGRLPAARAGLAAVNVGGTAYLVGGSTGAGDVLATTDGRHFRSVGRLPVPVRDAAVAALGDQIWVFGGQAAAGPVSDIQRVTVPGAGSHGTARAVLAGHLPRPVTGAAAVALGGTLFIAGGQVSQAGRAPASAISDQVLAYRPGSAAVRVAGQLPVAVAGAGVAVAGDTAYLVGGNDGVRPVPTVTRIQVAADPPASTPWSGRPLSGSHLAPGSDPAALPGDVLIADHKNNRLLIVDPQGRIRWQFPQPGDLAKGQTFPVPDDAFFTPDGKQIVATEEDASVISVIDIASRRIVYRYGVPWHPGSGANHVSNPDDAMMLPSGSLITADIKNCRVLLIRPPAHRPQRVIGQPGYGCWHSPPVTWGSPNGAFPMTNGKYLVTEINGDWVDALGRSGHVSWSANPPGVAYPSDSNEIYPGRYLTVDYSAAGQVVEFSAAGRRLWRFGGLNHPSLGLPLPNGDILVNDDFNDRVIVIDPVTSRIVWQYGHKGVPGTAPGYLNDPDGVDLTPPNSLDITHAPTMGQP
jgi:DNA-binding beta-propeller fold protein YncE